MRKILTWLLAAFGLTSGCGQQHFDSVDVAEFAALLDSADVALLDVRTPEEFAEGHLDGAVNIDVKGSDFLQQVQSQLPTNKTVAVYCRSGRRSVTAARQLAEAGYRVVNLKGGILAWESAAMPTTTTSYEIDEFHTASGKTVRMYALMHGSLRIAYDGKEIEIDPVTRLRDRTIDYTQLPKADIILVTHEHSDHLDSAAIATLSRDDTRLVTNRRCADILGKGEVMANGDTLRLAADILLAAVPAYNTTAGHLQYHPKGRDNGFVLTIDGLRIYIAGDTEDIPEMTDIQDIDIALMPCNQPYTMTAGQLVDAARVVKPKVLFPYHYGMTDVSGIPAQLAGDGIDVRIRHYE